MKTLRLVLALLTVAIVSPVIAQNPEPTEGTAKVKIIKNINGQVTVIEKDVPISDKAEIDQMLKDLNISEELEDNENIEIIIRQGGNDHPMHWREKFVEVDDRPLLGVYVGSTTEKIITNEDGEETVEISEGDGTARISGIVEGSGAEKAGLKEGDVITSIGDHAVTNYETLVEAIGSHEVGDVVTVNFEREGVAQSVQATLGERKHEMSMPFMGPMGHHMMRMPGCDPESFKKMCDPDRGFLGVNIRNVEENEGSGVYVTGVMDNTAASELGLTEGDIITEINGVAVNNVDELRAAIGERKVGDEVKVGYLREGKKEKGTATLKKCEPEHCMPGMGNMHEQIMKSLEGIDWEEIKENFDSEEFQQHMQELQERLQDMEFDMMGLPGGEDHRMIAIMIRVDDLSAEDKELLENNNPGLNLGSGLEVDNLKFSPNPSDGQFELNFELSEPGPVSIRIFDPSGREVYNQRIEDFNGTYSNAIDISGNSDGAYFLLVEQGGKTFTRKVVIQ